VRGKRKKQEHNFFPLHELRDQTSTGAGFGKYNSGVSLFSTYSHYGRNCSANGKSKERCPLLVLGVKGDARRTDLK